MDPAVTDPGGSIQSTSMGDGATPGFRSVYEAQLGFVWSYVRRLGVAAKDVEDVTHDVFVVLHRELARFEPGGSMRALLAGIALRVVSDHRRREGYRQTSPLDDEVLAVPEDRPGAELVLTLEQRRRLLFEALGRLPPERRDVVVLHDVEGFSMPEIARMVTAPLNTLYSRLRLGRRQIEGQLRALAEEERP